MVKGSIKGYDRLVTRLTAIGEINDKALIALEKGATLIETHAKDNAPFHNRSGELRKRITTAVISNTKNQESVGVGSGMTYAPHVEFGTKKSKAYPFLRPAFNAKQDDVVDFVRKELEEIMKGYCL